MVHDDRLQTSLDRLTVGSCGGECLDGDGDAAEELLQAPNRKNIPLMMGGNDKFPEKQQLPEKQALVMTRNTTTHLVTLSQSSICKPPSCDPYWTTSDINPAQQASQQLYKFTLEDSSWILRKASPDTLQATLTVCGSIPSATASTSAATAAKMKKTVRFAIDAATGAVLVYKRESGGPLSEDDCNLQWWSASDYKLIRSTCRNEAIQASNPKTGSLMGYCSVFDTCLSGNLYDRPAAVIAADRMSLSHKSEHGTATAPGPRPSSQASSSPSALPSRISQLPRGGGPLRQRSAATMYQSLELADCVRIVSSTGIRGLEVIAFPPIKRHRRAAIQGFIRAQSKLPGQMPETEKQVVLASKSRLLSRPFRQLAWVLGAGDALAVGEP
jgi:hypothetical protein